LCSGKDDFLNLLGECRGAKPHTLFTSNPAFLFSDFRPGPQTLGWRCSNLPGASYPSIGGHTWKKRDPDRWCYGAISLHCRSVLRLWKRVFILRRIGSRWLSGWHETGKLYVRCILRLCRNECRNCAFFGYHIIFLPLFLIVFSEKERGRDSPLSDSYLFCHCFIRVSDIPFACGS
jgi:hypothetical protein